MKILMVAFILILAGCSAGQGASSPTPADPTPTPSVVVQAECPEPTACPGPTACPPAPTCPEPVTCPTCAEPITCPTCPEPVVCPTCPETVTCPPPVTCPDDAQARVDLADCQTIRDRLAVTLVDCDKAFNDCKADLELYTAYTLAWECRAICEQTNCCGCGEIAPSCVIQMGKCQDYCPAFPE